MADYLGRGESIGGLGSMGSRLMEGAQNAGVPKQRPIMELAFAAVQESEKQLADRIECLAARLSPILHNRPSDAVNGKELSESAGAAIPDELFGHARALQSQVRRLQHLIDSLAI